ncbi:MAG: flavin reductase family protein [Proteobacteria bacterium]|nr:flavin reductase family protein [Pseudomonadota bacterium]
MHDRNYLEQTDQLMEQIKKGAFLTVRAGGAVNTMTIGWAAIGYIWQRPVLMVAVRDSRHTFTLMEQTDNFTVTIPLDPAYKQHLAYCGTKSGRDVDKFAACNLPVVEARLVDSPIIGGPGIHYECKVVYKSAMDPAHLAEALGSLYPHKDYHTLYFGEILACYETK